MTKPWKCIKCKQRLGLIQADRVHIQKQQLEAIVRVGGGFTLTCPKCGALNELNMQVEDRQRAFI